MGVVDGSIHWNGQNNFFDFIQFHAERLGMTREEYIAHFGTANHGINETKKKPGPDPYHRGLDDEEVEDKEAQIKKQAKMDDDDPDAYKEMPGDKEAREKGEVKTSKATKAYNKLYGEGVMSNIHLMIDASKDFEDFKKKFKKDYRKVFQNTPDFMDCLYGMYKDAAPEKVEEFRVVNEMAMGYDAHTGLFYMQGVPFTQERLEQALKYLRTKLKLGKLPKQFNYYPSLQVADNAVMEMVTLDLQDAKKIEDVLKRFKGKLAHDGDFDEEIMEASHSGSEASDKMAFSQLERIIDYATMIRDRMAAGKGLDAWMYGKVIKAEDYLNTLYDVIDGDDGVVETQKMTNKDWKKIKKFNKHVTDSGEKFVMSYDDRIGTFLEPVEIVDEAKSLNEISNKNAEKYSQPLRKLKNPKKIRNIAAGTGKYNDMLVWLSHNAKNLDYHLDGQGQLHVNGEDYEMVRTELNESSISKVNKHVEKVKKALKKKWAKKGGYENFGQDEIRKLQDEYDYHSMVYGTPEQRKAAKLIDGLDQWAMNYVGEAATPENPINEEDDADKKSTDRGPLDDDKIETALKKKAKDTGVPIGIIRAVMRRGLAAWKSGHRPGANQQQWGYARVNAFLTKGEGTWGKADSDLAKEVRDGGHDKKLKKA